MYECARLDPVNRHDPKGLDDDDDDDDDDDGGDYKGGYGFASSDLAPCNQLGGDCLCVGAVVLDPACVAIYGSAQAVAWLTPSARAQLVQEYQQCVANVQQEEQKTLADIQTAIAAVETVNDVLSLAINVGISGSVGYAAATAAVVTGVATTLTGAATVGVAVGVLSYLAGKVAGLPEDWVVAAFEKLADYVAPKVVGYGASKQIAQCAAMYPGGQ
jgi:hypothetical protein